MSKFAPSLRSVRRAAAAFATAGTLVAGPAWATVVTEIGDAGQTQGSAQVTSTVGGPAVALTDIFGSLSSSTDADLYLINIINPATFSATTMNALGGFLDTQLFLLTLAGAPVYLNDDDAGGLSALSTLPAGHALRPLAAGLYLLGVSLSGYDPVNVNGQSLFASGLPTDVRGPANGLQPARLGGFADNTFFADSGAYNIQLTGASSAVPEPTSALLAMLACALCGVTSAKTASKTGRRPAPV